MIGTLKTIVLDAPDIAGLSAFSASLAGWTQTYADEDWITLTTGDGWRIGLQQAPDHVPPRWPDQSHPQQAHLDLRVPDIDTAATRAVDLGATLLRRNETWHTLADPAGHPFDLCRNACALQKRHNRERLCARHWSQTPAAVRARWRPRRAACVRLLGFDLQIMTTVPTV
jgi:predicted enzyme related to lactoylglutathione lyase